MVRWIRFPYELTFFLSPSFHISISFKLHRFGRYCFNGGLICPSFLPSLPSLPSFSLCLYFSASLPLPISLPVTQSLSLSLSYSLSQFLPLSLSLFIYLSHAISLTVPLLLSNSLSYTSPYSLDLPLIDRYRRWNFYFRTIVPRPWQETRFSWPRSLHIFCSICRY